MKIDKSYDFIVHDTDGALKMAFNTSLHRQGWWKRFFYLHRSTTLLSDPDTPAFRGGP